MEVKLQEQKHPNKAAELAFDELIAIDGQKEILLNSLELFFHKEKIERWRQHHHSSGLNFLSHLNNGTSLIILSGDVGCGKTALAHSIGTPLGKRIDKRITVFETPSNIRGAGRVGEISNRITDAFEQVKSKLTSDQTGILIIDEADDLATDRDQNQAHHEDRAGLNVLLKQIDLIARENVALAVILITNRLKVLDPAIIRRATQIIEFGRPDEAARKLVFQHMFNGSDLSEKDYDELVKASTHPKTPYSFSDLIQKVGRQSLFSAIQSDQPFGKDIYLTTIKNTKPSPILKQDENR
ncbi:MAG TPA: ATP-binding protein [Fluviicola sp.]|nr:ATP-binding protein [Fluviicola sp.]